jgi:hypothetical protein
MANEKREFLRIPTRIKGHARFLESDAEMPLYREAPTAGPGVFGADSKEGLSDSLFALLSTINAKLDMLISVQSRESLEDDFPIGIDVIEISGAGLRFLCNEELSQSANVEVVLVLNQFPLRLAGAIGKVIRQGEESGRKVYALDFTKIRERDLEGIVQFVFQSQRDEIRGKKWS